MCITFILQLDLVIGLDGQKGLQKGITLEIIHLGGTIFLLPQLNLFDSGIFDILYAPPDPSVS